MGLFLTKTELEELTGYKLASYQVGWLKAQGYYVETNAQGIPKITYAQVENQRSSKPNSALIETRLPIDNQQPNMQKLQDKIGFNHG